MPRPKPFTEELWRQRRQRQRKSHDAALRRAKEASEAEIEHDVGLADDLITMLGLPRDRRRSRQAEIATELATTISKLTDVLVEVRREWQVRQEIRPDLPLPILGEIRPTRGEMHVTLAEGLEHAKKLRDWYRSLPEELLFMVAVPLAEGDVVALGAVIERLTETLEAWTAAHKPRRGRQPGRRAAARSAARYLIQFIDRHAPDAPAEARRRFVFCAMRDLGIDCPNLEDDPGDFATWFSEVEAIASPPTPDIGT